MSLVKVQPSPDAEDVEMQSWTGPNLPPDDSIASVDPYNVIDFDRNKLIMDLPSRQVTRGGGGATLRQRPKTGGTTRAKSKRSVHLTDIDSDDEDGEDEQQVQKKQQNVKAMATTMESKRQARNTIKTRKVKKLSCWKSFKLTIAMGWYRFTDGIKESVHSVELWKGHLKEVEGQFGNGVLSYFLFLKWLFFLNWCLFILLFGVLTVPSFLISYETPKVVNGTNVTCTYEPDMTTCAVSAEQVPSLITDFITGQGCINTTLMFYSNYPPTTGRFQDYSTEYKMPLAYLLVGGMYFFLSLLLMASHLASGFEESYIEGGGTFYSYCNKVFASWDYCITDEKAAKVKSQNIIIDIEAELAEERRLERIMSRTKIQKTVIYTIRLLVNLIVLALLAGAIYAIIKATEVSTQPRYLVGQTQILKLLISSASSLTITGLNLILPTVFQFLSTLEDYSPRFVVVMDLWRTVILKVVSLMVLMWKIYSEHEDHECDQCWENKIASQMYMLIWIDFFVVLGTTIFYETVRKLLYKYTKIGRKIGKCEFQIPKNVLALVYDQSLIWLGTFFAPLLPAMSIVKLFLMFYIKKFSLMGNFKPSEKPYQGARTNYLFIVLLLLVFMGCLVGVGWGITRIHPSCCGPFSNSECNKDLRIYTTITDEISTWASWLQDIVVYMGTAAFIFPAFMILLLLLYYFRSMTSAHERMIEMLRDQLVMEGRDKRFLMERLVMEMQNKKDEQNETQDTHLSADY